MIKYLPKDQRECPICHSDMVVDYIDYDFKGKQDEYYVCERCKTHLKVLVRFGKVWKKEVFVKPH